MIGNRPEKAGVIFHIQNGFKETENFRKMCMDQVKETMISLALQQYEQISPCGNRGCFSECFTHADGFLIFWFDTPDRSTHVVWRKVAHHECAEI